MFFDIFTSLHFDFFCKLFRQIGKLLFYFLCIIGLIIAIKYQRYCSPGDRHNGMKNGTYQRKNDIDNISFEQRNGIDKVCELIFLDPTCTLTSIASKAATPSFTATNITGTSRTTKQFLQPTPSSKMTKSSVPAIRTIATSTTESLSPISTTIIVLVILAVVIALVLGFGLAKINIGPKFLPQKPQHNTRQNDNRASVATYESVLGPTRPSLLQEEPGYSIPFREQPVYESIRTESILGDHYINLDQQRLFTKRKSTSVSYEVYERSKSVNDYVDVSSLQN